MPFSSDHALDLLRKAESLGRLGHAYLISGPKEAGLEPFASRLLGVATGSSHPHLDAWQQHEARIVRPSSKSRRITVEQMRDLEKEIHMTTGPSGFKLGVIVDAERMNAQAQNAFLKTLEEPPDRTLILLITHHPQQLLTTILSRVIEISLLPPPGVRHYSEEEEQLLAILSQLSSRQQGSVAGALTLKAGFQEVLESLKTSIQKDLESDFKKEQEHYKNTTDGTWLKQREEQIQAMIAARYQEQRDAMMDLLLSWMGDIARQQAGASHLDLAAHADTTATMADRWEPLDLQKRLRALRRLDRLLHTNVNEGLALEVCFIEAFA